MPKSVKKEDNYIIIKGARVHNLKDLDINIPRDKFIVITGLSGSGKSSLAFDTLYAEGQRRYVESLSAYARQFLGRIDKPDVDHIIGIPPAIAIEQKVNTRNSRSTVGTSTEIYDYLKLLFARIGKTISPVSGKIVKKDSVTDVVNHLLLYKEGTRAIILAPFPEKTDRKLENQLDVLLQQGFTRIELNNEILNISEIDAKNLKKLKASDISIVIDRITISNNENSIGRMSDSVQTALFEGNGYCCIRVFDSDKTIEKNFSDRFEADNITFDIPSVHLFSFNNPVGACQKCEGFGNTIGIDEDLVVPNKNLSIYEDAIVCWKGEKMKKWKEKLIYNAEFFNFPVHRPFYELNDEEIKLLWTGNKYFKGLNAFFKYIESKSYKIQYRVMLSRYRGKTTCPECNGSRLRKEASYVKINKKSICELVLLPIEKLDIFFNKLKLNKHDQVVGERLLLEIQSRIQFLKNVGLGYLSLNRLSSTLSGGESQRINLASSIGSSLVGSLYILDEPSIGLHARDTHLLINVLKELKEIGNTVLVVEHDEEIIRAADEIIDIGPGAGRLGGKLVFQGSLNTLIKSGKGLTSDYITGKEKIELPESRRKWSAYIEVIGARENNLKGLNVKFPLNILTVVTGVSGSGKSSLVKKILFTHLNKRFNGYSEKTGNFARMDGNTDNIANIEFVDQNPIGRSSRSNPVTYLKAFDEIRALLALQPNAKYNGYKSSYFSFNIDGGRCDECQGEGTIKVEMQFMADVHLLCESCKGKRFKDEILDVRYRSKNVHDILEMTVNEAISFFSELAGRTENRIINKLQPLADVGLGYVKLGQSSNTLSGGESQRIKLASFLAKGKSKDSCLFIFDEPTTGLHFHDIKTLLMAFDELIKNGHTVIIIEHNPEVIKSADWIIDLGPEGGDGGGEIIFEGTPDNIIKEEKSYTGRYLKAKL
ncbi:excinuclease ABC subunit UvrA [Bacteroidota bacterium]